MIDMEELRLHACMYVVRIALMLFTLFPSAIQAMNVISKDKCLPSVTQKHVLHIKKVTFENQAIDNISMQLHLYYNQVQFVKTHYYMQSAKCKLTCVKSLFHFPVCFLDNCSLFHEEAILPITRIGTPSSSSRLQKR